MRIIILVVVLIAGLGACNTPRGNSELIVDDKGYVFHDELFKDFYLKFHSDSVFQIEHVQFPLQGLPDIYSPSNDTLPYFYYKSNWTMQQLTDLNKKNIIRRVEDQVFLVKEQLVDQQGYGLERRFMKDGDSWKLIYYSGYNPMHLIE